MFKGIDPGEATLIGAASSMVTNHDSYIEVRKSPQYGTWDFTLKDKQLDMMLLGIDMVLVLVPNS